MYAIHVYSSHRMGSTSKITCHRKYDGGGGGASDRVGSYPHTAKLPNKFPVRKNNWGGGGGRFVPTVLFM